MSDYRRLSEELRLLFDEVLYEPLPARLRVERYRGRTATWAAPLRWLGLAEIGLVPRLAGIAVLLLAGGRRRLDARHERRCRPSSSPLR